MKTRNNLRAYCIVALLAISSLVLMGAAGGQQSAGEQRFQEIMNSYRADGMVTSQKLTEKQAEAILKDASLKRYETAAPSRLPIPWPAQVEVSYIYEVNHLVVRGSTQLEVIAPGATPYGYAEEAYLLTKHGLTRQQAFSLGQDPVLHGEYGVPLEKTTFQVAPSNEAYPVYFVTKWKAAKVDERMTWPKPSEVAQLQLQPRSAISRAAVDFVVSRWSLATGVQDFLTRYPSISKYGVRPEGPVVEQHRIVASCGGHAQVIQQLAVRKNIPALYVEYTAHWSTLNEGHAFTALWDGTAWVNNPFPWEPAKYEIGPVLGRSMVGSRPGSPQTTIHTKGTVVPVR